MNGVVRLAVAMMVCGSTAAAAGDLFQSDTIVTGMDARSRGPGLTQVLRQVLTKVSGNPAWLADPRVGDGDAAPLVESLAYLDREGTRPKHDEQGTRDRPYDLIVRFARPGIERMLVNWGDKPWPGPRPLVTVDVSITPRTGATLPLLGDTDADERHRAALVAAAERYGLPIRLPLAGHPAPHEGPRLSGQVRWSDAEFGWVATWTLAAPPGPQTAAPPGAQMSEMQTWEIRGVSFDAAYRNGVEGAVRILSGHASGR